MAFFSSGRQPLGSSNKKLGNDTGRNLPDEWVAVDWLRREAVRFDHGLKIASNGSTAWSHDWFSGGALVGEYEHPKMFNRLVNILFNLKIFFLKPYLNWHLAIQIHGFGRLDCDFLLTNFLGCSPLGSDQPFAALARWSQRGLARWGLGVDGGVTYHYAHIETNSIGFSMQYTGI